MSARAGKGIFSFISKNPTIIGLGILAVTLFIFRDRISNFVSGGITGTGQAISGAVGATGEFFGGAAEATGEFFGGIPESVAEFLGGIELPTLPAVELPQVSAGIPFIDPLGQGLGAFFGAIAEAVGNIFQPMAPTDAEVTGVEGLPIVPEVPVAVPIAVAPAIAEQVIAPFVGGGPSFEGGFIFETPVEFLSLSQIIDRFMVTASQAADIRAEAIGFDGGFIPEGFFEQQLQGLPVGIDAPTVGGITGDPQFIGLTPEEIAQRLTGGLITRF